MESPVEEVDVLIIGAGLSGINSAYRLSQAFPDLKYAILEKRDVLGGTWSFWRYPGIRSDSSLALFGFPWYPWPHDDEFAPGRLIVDYLADAAAFAGIDKHIRYGHNVRSTAWSSEEQRWTLTVEASASAASRDDIGADSPEVVRRFKSSWIFMCSGYYDYSRPRQVDIPGLDKFQGEVVHPQFWDHETVAYSGKRVVVVGSGATAITLLPSLAEEAAHVTMLQRSPSFVMSLPSRDRVTLLLRRVLGIPLASRLDWWRRMVIEALFVQFLLRFPRAGRRVITAQARALLPEGYPVDVHFNPRYNPFQQRLCLCPSGDFFAALGRPNCEIVTAVIETCDEGGIRLKPARPGQQQQQTEQQQRYEPPRRIDADMIITATGLHMQIFEGGVPLVDGVPHPLNERYVWRSCMMDGIPNSCAVMGYTMGTWTPGADVHIQTVLEVMRRQRRAGATSVMPYIEPEERARMPKVPVLPNNSTYIVEAGSRLPLATGKDPWRNGLNWWSDAFALWFGGVTKGLRFITPGRKGKSD